MFTVSPADVLTSAELAKVAGERSPGVGPMALDASFEEDFAPTEFLSPFVDDVDFVFPEGDDLLSEEIPKTKRARNGAHSFDETGLGGDSSQFSQFASWTLPQEKNLKSDKDSGSRKSGRKRKNTSKDDLDGSSEHLEDLLSVLAARVAPVDGSTAEIFDSDEEARGGSSDFGSDEAHTNSDGDSDDSKALFGNNSFMQGMVPNSPMLSGMTMSFPKSDFGMQLLPKEDTSERKGKRGRKRPKITPEEKAELLRQRNREHARSTRRRKKMYVECLKKQVAELLAKQQQIDSGIFEPLTGSQAEEITIRKAMIQTFLQYRTTNVVERSRWRDLLDEAFTLTQPRTPFRASNMGEVFGNNRRVKGIDAVVQDTASVTAMLEMIKSRVRQQKPDYRRGVSLTYTVDSSDILVVGDRLMCHWATSTKGLVAAGFSSECSVDGMLKCTFNGKHKLLDMEITYDVMAFTRQLQTHSLIDLSVVSASVPRPGSMMRVGSAGKLPLRGPGSVSMPPMASFGAIKPPSGLKKVKSAPCPPTGMLQLNPGMMMPGMIPMMLPPGMQMKMQLPMPGMPPMGVMMPTSSATSSISTTSSSSTTTTTPSSTPTPTPSDSGDSAVSRPSSTDTAASATDDVPKSADGKSKGQTKTPIMPSMFPPMMMGMMPGMGMMPMPGMPLFPMPQPGHMYQPPTNSSTTPTVNATGDQARA